MSIPAAITAITVSGLYVAPDGSAVTGSVSFTPSVAATTPGALLPVSPLTVELDSTGAFSVALAATDDPQWAPSGFTYTVTERINGARARTYSIVVPAASPGGVLDLATVAPAVPATSVTPYLLAANNLADLTNAATARTNLGVAPSAWLTAPLGTNITAHTAVTPGTQLLLGRVTFRGVLAWAAVTIGGGSTLLTVDTPHRPLTVKTFSIRTSANSNVSSILELNPDGTLVNGTSFGAATSAHVGLDGLSYDLS